METLKLGSVLNQDDGLKAPPVTLNQNTLRMSLKHLVQTDRLADAIVKLTEVKKYAVEIPVWFVCVSHLISEGLGK